MQWKTDAPLLDAVTMATDPERVAGTVNFIAIDGKGDICSGVSTSGWAWKYPGRVGDSPIIGAGNYADNRHGACACTGMGEMAIRACTAYGLVSHLRAGLSIKSAGQKAMEDLRDLGGEFIGGMNLIALDRDGNHVGMTTRAGNYVYCAACRHGRASGGKVRQVGQDPRALGRCWAPVSDRFVRAILPPIPRPAPLDPPASRGAESRGIREGERIFRDLYNIQNSRYK